MRVHPTAVVGSISRPLGLFINLY
ncbi:hypothetical protein LINPERHAP2_LOCUS25708 [Linum perenne]